MTEWLQVAMDQKSAFRIDNIARNSKFVYSISIVRHSTGFFEFLGPAVTKTNYWGGGGGGEERKETSPSEKARFSYQFLLILMKLKLNLHTLNLAARFGIFESLETSYVTIWVCFLYQHYKEIEWMPAFEQVTSILPYAFRQKYPTTFTIIDGSEVFIETPSDL